jgi:hypothetical protein
VAVTKILYSLIISAIAFSSNVNASTVTLNGLLGIYETEIVDDTSLQSGTVGDLSIDPIIAYTALGNSGDPTEMDWMTAVYDELGITYDPFTSIQKIEFDTTADSDAYWTDLGGGIYTGDLVNGADNYLLKIGEGNLTYDTFLYENFDSLFQATISLNWLEGFSEFDGQNFDIYRISHISVVPVPAAVWLFGTALIGLIGFGKRRKSV